MEAPTLTRGALQVLGGHWTHAFQLKKEASGLLSYVWKHIKDAKGSEAPRAVPVALRRELAQCVCGP